MEIWSMSPHKLVMRMVESTPVAETSAGIPSTGPDAGFVAASLPSFKDIYKTYFDFVWSSAGHLGAASEAIDDIVQDVFLVIHAKLHTLQRPEALRSWIYGIVRRTVSDHRRARKVRAAAGAILISEPKPRQRTPLDFTEMNSELEVLRRILTKLDEQKREVFVMVEVLEMTAPEVAQSLEIPLNTAYSRLRQAREAFEEELSGLNSREPYRQRL
jgi:RNA polymerase sigma-70 factor (ECF subfamily)